ncbi:MAG: flagellar M-ring protein FliF [Deltaproteobacteria bacterium]|jgi:flagellar M-ring protein FliF|nr:flagellar M-ring protein FliF [Deltaproteobacteria bacterium]MBW2482841.1 flagellar M-ring protein FliF [Deltaproteobacteria bacterium]
MEAFRQILSQLNATFSNLSLGKRITLMTLVLGSVAGFLFLMNWSGQSEFQPLYAQLDPQDASAVLSRLREQKIDYRIASNGSTVLIPQEHIYETRMQLASEGLPRGSGVGFEIFDNSKLGMTAFAQNVNYQRALQGELARTINQIAEIESCRVHIVMTEKSLFIDEEEPASASVVLKLRAGKWLNQGQIDGILHLVSSSVARLNPENVTIVNSKGKLLAGAKDPASLGSLSSDQLDYQDRVEKALESRILTMLESALGENKAIVRLSASFDFKKQERTEEHYLPDNRVVRSEQQLNEMSVDPSTAPQGIPGIRSNLPGDPAATQQSRVTGSKRAFEKNDRTVNYEIGKVISHIKEPVGEMTRVSVAVLVDGTYQPIEKAEGAVEWQYVPRTPEEMQKFESIVKRAVNFDQTRGDQVDIVNIPFETTKLAAEDTEAVQEDWMELLKKYQPYLKYGFLSLFLLLSFVFFVKPLVRWLTEYSFGDMQMFKQLPKTVGELEGEFNPDANQLIFRDQASNLIASDKDASLGVMRDWIKES